MTIDEWARNLAREQEAEDLQNENPESWADLEESNATEPSQD